MKLKSFGFTVEPVKSCLKMTLLNFVYSLYIKYIIFSTPFVKILKKKLILFLCWSVLCT